MRVAARLSLKTILLAATCLAAPALAQETAQQDRAQEEEEATQVDEIVVTAIKLNQQEIGAGVLADRTILETPFSVSSFDESLVQNLNVRSLNQLLRFDPSAQVEVSDTSFGDFVNIRGFEAGNQYAGLPDLVFSGRLNIANLERIQIFRGVNVLSEGAGALAQIGGTVSQIPKKPLNQDLTEITAAFDANSQFSGQVDFSRRFADDRIGVRVNLFALDGDGTVDFFSRRAFAGTINVDARITETLTLNGEFGAVDDGTRGYRDNLGFRTGSITRLPDAPKNSTQFGQPWVELNGYGNRFYVNANWRPIENWSVDASYGEVDNGQDYKSAFGEVINDAGDLEVIGGILPEFDQSIKAGQITGRGRLATGPVEHRLTIAYGTLDNSSSGTFQPTQPLISNIYRPVFTAAPMPAGSPSTFANGTKVRTFTAFDDLRLFNGSLSVLAGVRRTRIDAGGVISAATTPLGAVNFFFSRTATVYASYGKAIEPGGLADTNPLTTNQGERLPTREVRQIEIGGKFQIGGIFLTAALFDLQRPLEYYSLNPDGTRTFVQAGRQVHKGFEFRAEGDLTDALRIISGFSYIDAKVQDNGVPGQAGNRAPGVPRYRGSLFVEYDIPALEGLTASTGIVAAANSFLDIDNRFQVPSYAQWDIGARYAFDVGGSQLVARVTVENVTDSSHYLPNTYFGLGVSSPRTLKTSLTVGF